MSPENPLALNVILKSSITHLQMSILIKDHSKSVNTWDSNWRPKGHQSICYSARQRHVKDKDGENNQQYCQL